MLGCGQWCADEYVPLSRTIEAPEYVRAMRVIRGAGGVSTNLEYVWPRRGLLERLWNLVGETSRPQTHPARSWNRTGGCERVGAGCIRLAMDPPDK